MRSILRAIFALVLLLGSGVGDWAPVQASVHGACCCGMPAGGEDSCPCPKPEGNRSPSPSSCSNRAVAVVVAVAKRAQAERRTEPRPEPATWAQVEGAALASGAASQVQGRDPDLTRHLARLSTFRI